MIERIKKKFDKENKPPLIILRIYKRHIVALLVMLFLVLSVYGAYFRYFMVLPPSAINVMPKFPYSLSGQRLLIISPNCDDESLGAGGAIQKALSESSEVRVVVTTDCDKHKIGQIRKDETRRALAVLGVPERNLTFLDFPEVDSDKKLNSEQQNLRQALKKEIDVFKPSLIMSPHPQDTHIDHKAAGLSIQGLAKENSDIKVAYYLIHYNFLKFPSRSNGDPERYLLPPAKLITLKDRWYILDLSNEEEDKKQEAIFSYKSQLSMKNPILHGILLDFIRENELFMIEEN